jgi:nucleoside-diphosphate-sugar epimerase
MTTVLTTGEPGFVGRRVILRLLAVGREVSTMVRSPRPVAQVSVIAADRDGHAGSFDDAAGCEFVDDRIHLLE